MIQRVYLGEELVNQGYITAEQLTECLAASGAEGIPLGEIVLDKNYITYEQLYTTLEKIHKMSYVNLFKLDVQMEVTRYVPAKIARKNNLAPVKVENNILHVALENPKDFRAIDEVRTASRMEIKPLLSSSRAIKRFIERIYGGEHAQLAISEYGRTIDLEAMVSEISAETGDASVVHPVNAFLEQALVIKASDIHIEPGLSEVRVRMRVDGLLTSIMKIPLSGLNAIITRLKILADLNIAERRVPQDGRFNFKVNNKEVDIRLSIIPTINGEKAVMRILDRSSFLISKERLGFTEENLKKFNSLTTIPHGIILTAGPTGSGKSTILYTLLNEMNDSRKNIVTVEDPVEYVIKGINQMQINPKAGMTFADGLRAILRQDPDTIMIGEMRDSETAETAIRAAITGHLVLSAIHTNDSASAIRRLVDMGIPNYLVASSVVAIISRRLLRRICLKCRTSYIPSEAEIEMSTLTPLEMQDIVFYKGTGCIDCEQSGYKGRMAVHEILIPDNRLRRMIHANKSAAELKDYAKSRGMKPLRESTTDLIKAGYTTISEMIDIVHGT